jgi:hypothetical protein
MKATSKLLAAAAFALACALPASAQAAPQRVVVAESFDDVSTLPGWALVNHSSPGGLPWFQGNAGVFSAHQGAASSYIAANFLSAQNGSGVVDNWLITPQLSLSGTSVLSFFTRNDPLPGFADTLEIRFSGNGGSTAPADFTVLLGTIGGGAGFPSGWQQFTNSIDFDGVGRFAFRYVGAAGALNYIGLDTVTITTVPEPAAWPMLMAGLFALALRRRHFQEDKS